MSNYTELILTCKDRAEAEKIADCLLKQKLIACAKFLSIDSRYNWEGKIVESQEVMVLMESLAGNFEKIEAEITKLHSYDIFVLKSLPITIISKKAAEWLEKETTWEK